MGKIDTSEWKGFRVGELFEKLNLRFLPNRVFDKASDISEVKSEEFNLPLVNAKHSNNGIMYYGRKHEWEYEVLTIDIVADGAASTGDVYAQPQETGVLYNAYLVKPKAKCVTGLILFFLSTVIQRCVKDHFGYDNKCTWDKVKHETILLPVDKTGQPDWTYMESYMANLETKVAKSLTLLQAAKDAEKKKVDTREWGEFRVGELFDAFLSKDDIQPKAIVEGNTPLVSSGKENNGIIAFIDNKNVRLWEANTLTVDMFGKVFYQGQPYYAVSHGRVNILMPRMSMAKHCMQFIGCAIERVTTDKYAFSEMCTGTKLLKDVIMLPKDKTGQPDWGYMEEYMRKMERKTNDVLNFLDRISTRRKIDGV
jgi:hypothetical protein